MSPFIPGQVIRLRRWLAGGALVAAVIAGTIACTRPGVFQPAYRFALFACLAPAIGAQLFALVHRCTGGLWGEALEPFLAAGSRLAPWIWLFVLPLLFSTRTAHGEWPHYESRAMLAVRAAVYGLVLFGVAAALARRRAAWIGPVGLIALLFSLHLLSDDWLVALEPGWSSTAFSLIWLLGQATAGLAAAVLAALLVGVSPDTGHASSRRALGLDLGNLLLTAAMLWCYVWFMQFLIIWTGNLPRETAWYLHRIQHAWIAVPVLLVALLFIAPLPLLLSRRSKRSPWRLGTAAVLLLTGQMLYLAWVILPALPTQPGWTGLLAAIALGDAGLALGLRHLLAQGTTVATQS